eukprot:3536632-Rhodomonas_salina.1
MSGTDLAHNVRSAARRAEGTVERRDFGDQGREGGRVPGTNSATCLRPYYARYERRIFSTYGSICLCRCACYAMPGTELAYGLPVRCPGRA